MKATIFTSTCDRDLSTSVQTIGRISISGDNSMYKSVHACRALAALLVVCYHLGETLAKDKYFGMSASFLQKVFSFGDCGVAFFFVLSGFIITLIHHKDFGVPHRFIPYLQKRITRIYPTYIIIFLAVYLLALASPLLRSGLPHDSLTLIKSILLVPQDKNVVGGTGAPVVVVAWTLQYEVVFYTAIALAIINRYLLAVVAIYFLACFVVQTTEGSVEFPHSFFANSLIFLFVIGMMVAYAVRTRFVQQQLCRPLLISTIAGLALLCMGLIEVLLGKTSHLLNHNLAYGIISGFLIMGLVRAEDAGLLRFGNGLISRLVSLSGDASYALYLIHFPLISILCKLAMMAGLQGTYGAVMYFLVVLGICVVVAAVFHCYVERPMLHVLSQQSRRNPVVDGKKGRIVG